MYENENLCVGYIGIGCWNDWLELTICIFVEGILHPRGGVKQDAAVRRKFYPDISGHVACTF